MSINTSGWSANKRALHNVLLANEIGGRSNLAYEISHAGTEKSGFSFGYNQMDISARPTARTVLEDIMDNAKDEQENIIISSDEKAAIKREWNTKGNKHAFTDSQKSFLNKALQSDYGKSLVDSDYSKELDHNLEHINSIVSVTNSSDKTFLETQVALLFLADYHNQYNLSTGGKMHSFLKGTEVKLGDKNIKKSDPINWFDLMTFYANTEYNLSHKEGGKRRAKQAVNCSDLSPDKKQEYLKNVDDAFEGKSSEPASPAPEKKAAHGPFVFPVDISKGIEVSSQSAGYFFNHTEKENTGGYFPLGANTVWHGGVHLRVEKGKPVYAIADGQVVAAKLAETDDLAKGHYGSHNFILVKHTFSANQLNKQFTEGSDQSKKFANDVQKIVYSLYMHLNNEVIDINKNKNIEKTRWLFKIKNYKVKKKINLRRETETTERTLIGELAVGTILLPLDNEIKHVKDQDWIHVKVKDGTFANREGYVATAKEVAGFIEPEYESDEEFVKSLKSGEVVKVEGRQVKAGDLLWTSGEYGTSPAGLVHWEMFSEENICPTFSEITDDDENCNLDSKKIFDMVEQDQGFFEDMSNLSSKEVIRFYKTNVKAASLRKFSCKFVNEWGYNLDVVIPAMKGRFTTVGLKGRMEPYLWWQKAKDKGVGLPASTHIWHYNPISVLSIMMGIPINKAETQTNSTGNATNSSKPRFPLDKSLRRTLQGYHNDANGGSRYFGARRDDGNRSHSGCDLIVKDGTPVYAIADGKILKHYDFGAAAGHTWVLEVAHGEYTVRYGEVKSTLPDGLKELSTVKRGQHIANVALFPSGSHMLHFEMYKGKELTHLTKKGNSTDYHYVPLKNYGRRAELMDPTTFLDELLDE